MEMCLAGVSTRGVDDISRLLWGERMPSRTLSDKLKKIYKEIDEKTANPPWPRQGRSRAKWRNASSRRPRTACARASARPPPASCRGSPRTIGSSCARTTCRAIEQGDPPAHPGRGRLPRLQQRAHARMRRNPLRRLTLVVGPAVHGHVPAR